LEEWPITSVATASILRLRGVCRFRFDGDDDVDNGKGAVNAGDDGAGGIDDVVEDDDDDDEDDGAGALAVVAGATGAANVTGAGGGEVSGDGATAAAATVAVVVVVAAVVVAIAGVGIGIGGGRVRRSEVGSADAAAVGSCWGPAEVVGAGVAGGGLATGSCGLANVRGIGAADVIGAPALPGVESMRGEGRGASVRWAARAESSAAGGGGTAGLRPRPRRCGASAMCLGI
jgi:hypothetical protein